MRIEDYIKAKKAFLIGFDNVLYPEKDYLLQVYYLFAEFVTYTELIDSAPIIEFMRLELEKNGVEDIFEKTAEHFKIPTKYKQNFYLLHQTARLPLKLLLFKQMLALLQELVIERREIYLILDGDPAVQLNKIKQTEWHGLEKYLRLYFSTEFGSFENCLQSIFTVNDLTPNEIVIIGNEKYASVAGIDYLPVTKLL